MITQPINQTQIISCQQNFYQSKLLFCLRDLNFRYKQYVQSQQCFHFVKDFLIS